MPQGDQLLSHHCYKSVRQIPVKVITDVFVNMRSLVYRDNRNRENRLPCGAMIQAGESSAGKQEKNPS